MKDTIKNLFEDLEHQFDVEVPNIGHQQRFLDKLNKTNNQVNNNTSYWKPLLAIAASVLLILSITFNLKPDNATKDLASISPEMAETQHFFSSTIAFELKKLNNNKSANTEKLINDALVRLDQLEKDYNTLKLNLIESGEDQRVIFAMITNFQNRIDLLQSTLTQIEALKTLKQKNYETTI